MMWAALHSKDRDTRMVYDVGHLVRGKHGAAPEARATVTLVTVQLFPLYSRTKNDITSLSIMGTHVKFHFRRIYEI